MYCLDSLHIINKRSRQGKTRPLRIYNLEDSGERLSLPNLYGVMDKVYEDYETLEEFNFVDGGEVGNTSESILYYIMNKSREHPIYACVTYCHEWYFDVWIGKDKQNEHD